MVCFDFLAIYTTEATGLLLFIMSMSLGLDVNMRMEIMM